MPHTYSKNSLVLSSILMCMAVSNLFLFSDFYDRSENVKVVQMVYLGFFHYTCT